MVTTHTGLERKFTGLSHLKFVMVERRSRSTITKELLPRQKHQNQLICVSGGGGQGGGKTNLSRKINNSFHRTKFEMNHVTFLYALSSQPEWAFPGNHIPSAIDFQDTGDK